MKLLDRYRFGKPSHRYDRALVLISSAFIEQGLESVISLATIMEYDDPSEYVNLFGGDRPGAINGFYGKIIVGHALGAYTNAFKEDLDRIRHLRNAFAHSKVEINFKTKEIADACNFHTTAHFATGENAIRFEDARSTYVFMAFFAMLTFQIIVNDTGPENRPPSYREDAVLP